MTGVGLHGIFVTRKEAQQLARRIVGAYVSRVKVRGQPRYLVLTKEGEA